MSVLTIEQIAFQVGKSRQALAKNAALKPYEVGGKSGGGRPAKLYHPDVLSLFKSNDETAAETDKSRRSRSDKGKPRGGRPVELVEYLTRLAFTYFMSAGDTDIRSSCRRAIAQAYRDIEAGVLPMNVADVDACAKSEWLYFNWVNRSCATFRGPAITQGWELCHRERYKQWDTAMDMGHNRHKFWKIAEHDLGAGRGRGRGRFVMLDDRKADVWTRNEDGSYEMCYAVYAWDVLTGELLWVERSMGAAVSGNDYVRCILGVLHRCGLDCQIWFLENSRAAKANPVTGAVRAIYTDADNEFLTSLPVKQAFGGQYPIVRNCPHIPKHIGKAQGERLFGEIKRWDALLYPQSYHGSGIHEAVQLTRSVAPVHGDYTPSTAEYFHNLMGDAYQEYLDQPRSILKEWAKAHGSEPTRRAMIEYYTPSAVKYPTVSQTALLLYHAILDRHVVKLREYGQIDCQINCRQMHFRADELYSQSLIRRKLTIIPIPGRDGEAAIYDANNQKDVRFVCVAKDYTTTTAAEVTELGISGRKMRESARQRVRDFTEKNLLHDPLELAAKRRKPVPELPPAQPKISYVEVVDESADNRILDNIHNLF